MTFRTLPTNAVTAAGASTTAVQGGAVGPFPSIMGLLSYRGLNVSTTTKSNVGLRIIEGFAGDGDFFDLPSAGTGTIDYFDSAGNQVTTGDWAGGILQTDIALTGEWAGFMLDATDELLYVATATLSATPTVTLASINVAGVITIIGTSAAIGTMTTAPAWKATLTNGASSIYRTRDGIGNIFLRSSSGLLREVELNITNGSIVTNTQVVASAASHYKTAKGLYIGSFKVVLLGTTPDFEGGVSRVDMTGANHSAVANLPLITGAPGGHPDGGFPLQWGGNVVMAAPTATAAGSRAFSVADFEKFSDDLAIAYGVS